MTKKKDAFFEELIAEANRMEKELIAIRRDLHRFPELGWMEMRTSSIIARKLKEFGCDEILTGDQVCDRSSRMGLPSEAELEAHYQKVAEAGADPEFLQDTRGGMTGVIGILHCGPGPVIGMRFDIDALPITESDAQKHFPTGEGFGSLNEGVMHACGHDGHTAIGLGTAKLLLKYRDSLKGTIKFIFQPAEEGVRGAQAIVAKGHLDDVDYLFGNHMGGDLSIETPFIGIGDGASLATTKMDVIYRGKAAHAGLAPENGNNAMLAMASAVLNLQAIPRYGKAATRVNVGKVTAGVGRNVICDTAKLELEVRGMTSEANDYMEEYAKRVIQAAGEMHGCSCEIRLMGAAKCGKNSPELGKLVYDVCTRKLQLPAKELPPTVGAASEDYSCMSRRVMENGGQSCYFMNLNALAGPIHNEYFDFQESALVNGVKVFAGMAAELMIEE